MGLYPGIPYIRELALFAGIGAGVLGSQALGARPVCYVENDDYKQEILRDRMRAGWLAEAPIWGDVRNFDARPFRGRCDLLTAGFPCKPWSSSNTENRGQPEKGGSLWGETVRCLRQSRPPVAILENVPGLLARSHQFFGRLLRDLAALRYRVAWLCLPASAIGAPHRRDRLWIGAVDVADADNSERALSILEAIGEIWQWAPHGSEEEGWRCFWNTESPVRRVVDGDTGRLSRQWDALGEAQVPAQLAVATAILCRRLRLVLGAKRKV